MKKIPLTIAALGMLVAMLGAPSSALADPPKKDSKGYAYEFPDDGLLGIEGQGTTPIIKVRPKGSRDLLHRPRLQFVTELLKSVENM